MSASDMTYLQENRHVAERLLIFLEDRRLLRDRTHDEDADHCRKSAAKLRKVLEGEMLNVRGGGIVLVLFRELRQTCTNFISAAGPKSVNFQQDSALFQYHLLIVREAFAVRIVRLVNMFDLDVSTQIRQIMRYGP